MSAPDRSATLPVYGESLRRIQFGLMPIRFASSTAKPTARVTEESGGNECVPADFWAQARFMVIRNSPLLRTLDRRARSSSTDSTTLMSARTRRSL